MINYQFPVVDSIRPNLKTQVRQQDIERNAGFETRKIGDRPFNYDICDDEHDKEREREEFEAHL